MSILLEDFESPTLKLPFIGEGLTRTNINNSYSGQYCYASSGTHSSGTFATTSFNAKCASISFYYKFSSEDPSTIMRVFIDDEIVYTVSGSSRTSWTNFNKADLDFKNYDFKITLSNVNPNSTSTNVYIDDISLLTPNFFLIQDNNQVKSSSDGINLTYVDNLPYNQDKFNDNGITNLSNITPTIIDKLVGPKYNIALLK